MGFARATPRCYSVSGRLPWSSVFPGTAPNHLFFKVTTVQMCAVLSVCQSGLVKLFFFPFSFQIFFFFFNIHFFLLILYLSLDWLDSQLNRQLESRRHGTPFLKLVISSYGKRRMPSFWNFSLCEKPVERKVKRNECRIDLVTLRLMPSSSVIVQ